LPQYSVPRSVSTRQSFTPCSSKNGTTQQVRKSWLLHKLSDEIDDLAKAHAGLGVKAAHFAPMGAALMATPAETLGAEFTPELEAAWHAAYDHFAALMIARGGFV
jgi:hemoglobin-like flavoprotein